MDDVVTTLWRRNTPLQGGDSASRSPDTRINRHPTPPGAARRLVVCTRDSSGSNPRDPRPVRAVGVRPRAAHADRHPLRHRAALPRRACPRRRHRPAHLCRAGLRHRGQRGVAGRPRDRPRRPHRHPDALGQLRALRRDPGHARHRRRLRSGRRRRPRRARGTGVHRGRRRRRHHRAGTRPRPRVVPRLARRSTAEPRRRVDHLHFRLHRNPQGCRGQPSQRRRVRRRRGADVPAGQSAGPRGPGAGGTVGGVRRLLRGDVAGVAARRLSGARPALAGAQRDGPGPLVGVARHHGGLDRADAGSAVAGGGPGGGAVADLRRRGLPARTRRAARGGRPRSVEHLRPDRSDRGGLCGAAVRAGARQHRPAPARVGSGGRRRRRPAGEPRGGRRAGHRRGGAGALPRSRQGRREVRPDAHARLEPRLPQRRPGPAGGRRVVFRRPRRRPGQGRRPPHRAR